MFILIYSFLSNIISAYVLQKRVNKYLKPRRDPLPDIIHQYLFKIPIHTPDIFLLICIGYLIYCMLTSTPQLYILDHIQCMCICLLIRSIFIHLTILPTCIPHLSYNNLYDKLFLSPHDLMFSGHSIIFIGIGHILNDQIIPIIGMILLVLARQHYTIDVIVAFLIYFYIQSNLNNIV